MLLLLCHVQTSHTLSVWHLLQASAMLQVATAPLEWWHAKDLNASRLMCSATCLSQPAADHFTDILTQICTQVTLTSCRSPERLAVKPLYTILHSYLVSCQSPRTAHTFESI